MATGASTAAGATEYRTLASQTTRTTEALAQVTMRTANLLKNLFVYVSVYSLGLASPIAVRINGSSSAITVSPNATGIFEDTSNSVTLVATDEANYIVDALLGVSGAITPITISIEETQPAVQTPFRIQLDDANLVAMMR